MKVLKKSLCLFITMMMFFTLLSCGETSTNDSLTITLEENVISWQEAKDALKYNIFANNKLIDTVKTTSYELKLDYGTYQIKISAVYADTISPYSNEVTYTKDKETEVIKKLNTPSIVLVNDVISWNEVKPATSYNIYVNGVKVLETTELNYKIDGKYDSCSVKVTAFHQKSNVESDYSNEVTFVRLSQKGESINIFAINDTHGAIIDDSSNVSMARVSTLVKELEKTDSYIKIANGDMFQGTYASNQTRGRAIIDTLNHMNFDLMVIGNHEFDWGLETIAKYKDQDLTNGEANFPILGANIIDNNTSSTLDWVDDYAIVNNNGYKVGIIGIIGDGLASSISAEMVKNYSFESSVSVVERLAKELRLNEKCDSVIVATHEYEPSTNSQFASLVGDARIDGIICAHTHEKIEDMLTRSDGKKIYALQSNTKNGTAGTMKMYFENNVYKYSSVAHYSIGKNYGIDPEMQAVIDTYSDVINEGERLIGNTSNALSKSSIGNLSCQAATEFLSIDACMVNTSGIRSTIPAGEIRVKDIFNVLPFDNVIYIVEVNGNMMKSISNYSSIYFYSTSDSFNTSQTYKLGIIDFLFTNNYYQNLFKDCNTTNSEKLLRDILIWKVEKDY